MKKALLFAAVGLALLARPASASTINFDTITGPNGFLEAGAVQHLTYTFTSPDLTVTLDGGVVLTGETQQTTNDSSVFATASILGADASLVNPITITFSKPILSFQVDILNAFDGNYLIFDNAGHSTPFFLALNGGSSSTQTLTGVGTQIMIQYLGGGAGLTSEDVGRPWDFAIDNIQFTTAPIPTPEPATCTLVGAGIAALVARRRRASR